MQRLAGFYMPVLFMTVPVAFLLRIGELLGDSFSLSLGGVGAWVLALLIPIAALFAPLVLFWQAGALFFFADRTSRHVSTDRAQKRIGRLREGSETATHGGRNFRRGILGKPAVNRDNQQLLDASRSRAHSAGTRVKQTRDRLQSVFTDRRSTGSTPDDDGAGGTDESPDSAGGSRNADFEGLRDRDGGTGSSTPSPTDDNAEDDGSTDDNRGTFNR
jgi:hypothetical protein